MKEKIESRFNELIDQGERLVNNLPKPGKGGFYAWVNPSNTVEYHAWLMSCRNFLNAICPPGNTFSVESERLIKNDLLQKGVPSNLIQKMLGMIVSAHYEWKNDLLVNIEYIFAAETFDDFLDHASKYHKDGMGKESSVLASAVLEDTVKKISKRNDISTENKDAEQIIIELTKKDVFTDVVAKRVRSFFATRKHAFHAEWDKVNIKDVGILIDDVRTLIKDFLP